MMNRVAFGANIRVGMDALRIHPLRTFLSVLGIVIGSASLVATMAVSDGLLGYVRGQVEAKTSVQVIALSSRTVDYRNGQFVPITDYPVFTLEDVSEVGRAVDGMGAVTMVLSGSAVTRYRGAEHQVAVTLGTEALPDFATVEVAAGRFFTSIDAAHNAPVVVLNYALARELAPGRNPFDMVGEEVVVHGRVRRVLGVTARDKYEDARSPEFALFAPIRAASTLLEPPASGRFTPTIQLKAPSVESVNAVRAAAVDWLARRYVRWPDRVRVVVGAERLAQVEQGILLAKVFFSALVGISLVVGGIGIMNVLLASVAERTREIGIRKAVGAAAADLKTQFLAESVSIAVAGTAVGLVLGVLMAVIVTAVFRQFVGAPVYPVLSVNTVLLAIASSSLVGLVFGTYPARRAAELPVVAAIAHE